MGGHGYRQQDLCVNTHTWSFFTCGAMVEKRTPEPSAKQSATIVSSQFKLLRQTVIEPATVGLAQSAAVPHLLIQQLPPNLKDGRYWDGKWTNASASIYSLGSPSSDHRKGKSKQEDAPKSTTVRWRWKQLSSIRGKDQNVQKRGDFGLRFKPKHGAACKREARSGEESRVCGRRRRPQGGLASYLRFD